MKCVNKQHICN